MEWLNTYSGKIQTATWWEEKKEGDVINYVLYTCRPINVPM